MSLRSNSYCAVSGRGLPFSRIFATAAHANSRESDRPGYSAGGLSNAKCVGAIVSASELIQPLACGGSENHEPMQAWSPHQSSRSDPSRRTSGKLDTGAHSIGIIRAHNDPSAS